MSQINSKNNIFKKFKELIKRFTWFDYLVFSLTILLLFGSFLFFFRKRELIDIKVKVTDKEVLYSWSYPQNWYADAFKIGDEERDTLGRKSVVIKDVETFNINEQMKAVYLDLSVEAVYDSRAKRYVFQGRPLSVGTTIPFSLSDVTFDGLVIGVLNTGLDNNSTTEYKTVKAIIRGVDEDAVNYEPKVLESLSVGDKVTSSKGKTLVELIGLKLEPAERSVRTDSGNLVLRRDPFYKDATLTLKVLTKTIGDDLFVLNDMPLRIGQQLPLAFSNKFVRATVVGIN